MIAAIRGAIKGIVWQLAVIGSIVLCFAFSETGSVFIAPMLALDPPLNRWVAMLILYIVLSFAAFGVARVMHKWIEKMKFKEYDRHLGFLFGAVKGVIMCLVGTFFVVTISAGYRETIMNSYSGHAAAIIMDRLHPVMPEELHDVLGPYIHQLDQPGLDLQHAHDDDDQANHSGDDHANAGQNGQTDGATVIDNLLKAVRGESADSLASVGILLKNALKNTSAEDRDELINNIRSADFGRLYDIADVWKNGKPAGDFETPPFDFDPPPFEIETPTADNDVGTAEREVLVGEIPSRAGSVGRHHRCHPGRIDRHSRSSRHGRPSGLACRSGKDETRSRSRSRNQCGIVARQTDREAIEESQRPAFIAEQQSAESFARIAAVSAQGSTRTA